MKPYEQNYQVSDLPLPKDVSNKWQKLVNLAALVLNVPAALIMRVDLDKITVQNTSQTSSCPYKVGDSEQLKGELYCETVMNTNQLLYVDNALNHDQWKHNPDIALQMTSYLGLPVHWPDGKMFGTICVLDSKAIPTTTNHIAILTSFCSLLEDELLLVADLTKERRQNEIKTLELEARNREMESFSYTIAHDLRAPLRAINSFTQLFIEELTTQITEKGRSYLEKVRNASLFMNQLIDDLLGLDKIRTLDLTIETFNVSQMAEELLAERKAIESLRKVELIIQPEVYLTGDKALIRVVMENLLDNAWKFTSLSQVTRIEFGCREIEGRKVCFVRDNGVGFNMKYADKLFGNFQKLHANLDFPGTGIGLATIQKIIHKQGGTVWAEGEEGKGACFYFTIDLDASSY